MSSLLPVDAAPATPSAAAPAARPAARQAMGAAPSYRWLGWVPAVLLLALLELSVRLSWVPRHLLPAPTDLATAAWELGPEVLATHALVSTARVLAGFAVGAGLALLVGAWVGLRRHAEQLLDPSFQALRAIPSLAWVPLLLLWLGIDETPKIALIAIGAFFPVYLAVSAGLRNVDRKLVEAARIAGLGEAALVRKVLIPAAMPAIFTGVRQALSLAWMFMVAAELIAATKGLGYLLTDGRETSRADLVLLAIVLLAVLGKLSDSLLAALERRWLHWRDGFEALR